MDTAVLIWIVIAIIVVAIIVVGALALTARNRSEQRRRAEHDKAEKLRQEARESELAAREGEARAAQTKADAASAAAAAQQAQARAAQADVEAQRLADSVGEHEADAMKHRAEHEETLRKADEVDPYVTADGSRSDAVRTDAADRTVVDSADANRSALDADDADRADVAPAPVRSSDGTTATRSDDVVTDRETVSPSEPITRPPARTAVPTVANDDAAVDADGPPSRTRTDQV